MIFMPEKFCRVAERIFTREQKPLSCPGGLWLFYLEKGRAAVQCAGAQGLFLSAGQLLFCPAGAQLSPTEPWAVAGIRFGGSLAEEIAGQLAGPLVQSGAAFPGAAEELTAPAQAEFSPARCFDLLCRLAAFDRAPHRPDRLTADAVAAIRSRYASIYGVQELADELGVSKEHLVRSFKAATGKTPGRYLTEVRLAAAMQLLADPACSVELAAQLSGFSGANYFCRVFRQHTGLSPNLWRKSHGAGYAAGDRLVGDEIYL